MVLNNAFTNIENWQKETDLCLRNGNYIKAASLYEQAINDEPNNTAYYWYLGLALLLQGKEEEAQITWLLGMANADADRVEILTQELVEILEVEAEKKTTIQDYSTAWTIRQHIREINPTYINNLLHSIYLSILLDSYKSTQLNGYGLMTLLDSNLVEVEIDQDLLLHLLKNILAFDPINTDTLKFTSVSVGFIENPTLLINSLIPVIYQIAYSFASLGYARKYTEILLNLAPNNQELLRTMAQFSTELTEYSLGLQYAEKSYSLSQKEYEQVLDYHLICRSMMAFRGCDPEVRSRLKVQEKLIKSLFNNIPQNLGQVAIRLYNTTFFFPYAGDTPQTNMQLRHQVAEICQVNLENAHGDKIEKYRQRAIYRKKTDVSTRKLRVGYLSHCLRRHSVGWLARWLFQDHDRDRFEIYAYMLGAKNRRDPLLEWYANKANKAYKYGVTNIEIAEQISEDDIDILIDLDSTTLVNTCSIVASKPAPIQATWLGWDASGIPTVDYFIADPYVLPEDAQNYYSEKIWRLPQTYLAVNGFEVKTPSIRRDNLGIPSDAIVYFTAQRGYKYNPDMAKLQMKIIKEVPNSYFLFKRFGDSSTLYDLLVEIARSEGVNSDRLITIEEVSMEEIHRANLQIADIVLDTYPYNGATTTLETLWMCIPIVTRVGKQFAARNSYTMMVNAGISEGIARTDEEYVEWGIRLGTDEKLREEVSWKLRKSKRIAPLWNTKQFTRDMESAYEQMWQIYMEGR